MLPQMAYRLASCFRPCLFADPPGPQTVQTPVIRFPLAVYSHRGGALERGPDGKTRPYVENTMPAFRNSARLRVDLLELDVQQTADKKVVVFHDKTLGRMAGNAHKWGNKRIRDVNYADLPPIYPHGNDGTDTGVSSLMGSAPTTTTAQPSALIPGHGGGAPNDGPRTVEKVGPVSGPGSQAAVEQLAKAASAGVIWADTPAVNPAAAAIVTGTGAGLNSTILEIPNVSMDPDACRIPLLEEVLREFPHIPIQIDIKDDAPGLVEDVLALVEKYKRERTILIGSFLHPVQVKLYKSNPHIPLFTSAWRAMYLRIAHAAGKLDKVKIYESAIIVPWRLKAWWGSGEKGDGYWYMYSDKTWVAALRERGVAVILYGSDLNDKAAYMHCQDAGATAICTDRPSLLQNFFRKYGVHGAKGGPGGTAVALPRPDADALCQHTGALADPKCGICTATVTPYGTT